MSNPEQHEGLRDRLGHVDDAHDRNENGQLWREAAEFASYGYQYDILDLNPSQEPICVLDDYEQIIQAGPSHRDYEGARIRRKPDNDSAAANGELGSAMEECEYQQCRCQPAQQDDLGADSVPSVRSRYVQKCTGRPQVRPVCVKIESALSDIGQPMLGAIAKGGGRSKN